MTPRLALFLAVLLFGAGGQAQQVASLGPQTVVRHFCERDAAGLRVTLPGWSRIAPLVEWALEPAWDHVRLISSYAVGSPVPGERGTLLVEVRYSVTADVSAIEIKPTARIESVLFQVRAASPTYWRIVGPPPPPFVFQAQADPEILRRSLESGGANFLANSVFVWRMLREAGWDVPYQPTTSLLDGRGFRAVKKPRAGDVVAYLRNGIPYHAGFLEAGEVLVSATLNGGLVRSTLDAFAGDVTFLRLLRPREPSPDALEPDPGEIGEVGEEERREDEEVPEASEAVAAVLSATRSAAALTPTPSRRGSPSPRSSPLGTVPTVGRVTPSPEGTSSPPHGSRPAN